jgi:UDP-N-acetylmuramoylalanine--D-glutamate ligase
MQGRSDRVLVVGLGRSGVAAARLAVADGLAVRVTDRRAEAELAGALEQLPAGLEWVLGGHPTATLDGVGRVIVSPGVPADAELLVAARARGLAVESEVEFAWRHRPEAPLVAVTGSNGKSTVTTLVGDMLTAGGLATVAGGNLGTAASELVLGGGWEAWVLEVSSFQTELFVELRPTVGVHLNLSQDHLERHPDLAAYGTAKARLFARQLASDTAVLNADDPVVAATATAARRRLFSLEGPAEGWLDGDLLRLDGDALLRRDDLRLAGLHNVANALAAGLAARALGTPAAALATTLRTFPGLAHRHRTVHEAEGVRWVDDSKATNVGATLSGLRGYPAGSVHLILGGQGKSQDFGVLLEEVARAAARVYVIGVDGPQIAEVIGLKVPVERCGTLEVAVARARSAARPGQWVLLAPACASFDQFSGYAERGDRFAALARGEEAACP